MNKRTWVRTSNVIGIIAIVALIYWVFTFIAIQVFGLRVFKENLTEIFSMSILGILALMSGALMLNIMFNLTRIAERHRRRTRPFLPARPAEDAGSPLPPAFRSSWHCCSPETI